MNEFSQFKVKDKLAYLFCKTHTVQKANVGTAIVISNDCFLTTAKLILDNKKIYIQFKNELFECDLVKADFKLDLALIKPKHFRGKEVAIKSHHEPNSINASLPVVIFSNLEEYGCACIDTGFIRSINYRKADCFEWISTSVSFVKGMIGSPIMYTQSAGMIGIVNGESNGFCAGVGLKYINFFLGKGTLERRLIEAPYTYGTLPFETVPLKPREIIEGNINICFNEFRGERIINTSTHLLKKNDVILSVNKRVVGIQHESCESIAYMSPRNTKLVITYISPLPNYVWSRPIEIFVIVQ